MFLVTTEGPAWSWRKYVPIVIPLLLLAAPAPATYWEMTCTNPASGSAPINVSGDPERGYLKLDDVLFWVNPSPTFPGGNNVLQAYRPHGEGMILAAFDEKKPGLLRYLADNQDYLPKQPCSVAIHTPTQRYSKYDGRLLPSLPDIDGLRDYPSAAVNFDAQFGDGFAYKYLNLTEDARLATPEFRRELKQEFAEMQQACANPEKKARYIRIYGSLNDWECDHDNGKHADK